MMSHINSYSRKKLGNKSPYEVFEFQYGRKIYATIIAGHPAEVEFTNSKKQP